MAAKRRLGCTSKGSKERDEFEQDASTNGKLFVPFYNSVLWGLMWDLFVDFCVVVGPREGYDAELKNLFVVSIHGSV